MEDMEGDAKYGCRTLPIVAGIRATKIYVVIWCVVLIASLVIFQLYVLQFLWWYEILYGFVFVIFPLTYLVWKLSKAKQSNEFAFLSRLSKLIMLTGILSMIFFAFYS
jgi:4-hydroxybenzoate polyprenyltransferase